MNKRRWKKYAKKEYCKSWYVSRYNKIVQEAKEYAIVFLDMSPFGICVRITDSKRGNLKHPLNVKVSHIVRELQPAFSGGHWNDGPYFPTWYSRMLNREYSLLPQYQKITTP